MSNPVLTGEGGEWFDKTTSKDEMANDFTLRDLFAGLALAGLLANPNNEGGEGTFTCDAFRYADDMLEAREEE